jgi:hypothetical protein
LSTLRKALVLAVMCALLAGFAGLTYLVPAGGASWTSALRWVGSFCCLGFLLGGIYAFDPDSDLKITCSAIGRMVFGLAAALLLSAVWRWPLEAAALAGLVGAALGYFGMSWAKHANF